MPYPQPYDPIAERHPCCDSRQCRCEPTEAERAYETYRERVDGRVSPASAWLAAWEARGERDAQIVETFTDDAWARHIVAEIRKQDAK